MLSNFARRASSSEARRAWSKNRRIGDDVIEESIGVSEIRPEMTSSSYRLPPCFASFTLLQSYATSQIRINIRSSSITSYAPHTGAYFTSTYHTDTYPAIDPQKRDLSRKYVFITGASKGIGQATAISYTEAGCAGIGIGARTDFTSLVPLLTQAAAPQIVAVALHVTDAESAYAAAASIASSFPRLDILINNAGYLEKKGSKSLEVIQLDARRRGLSTSSARTWCLAHFYRR
ncbi:hypothetical protein ETB97_010898 [Aspergillus alliaceus]|uniref:Uncharacterized protein n=1 Tax=Petromyces alliaceus TaxID=209559 RepID=A0A8H6E856_PETAA|nr:hypothetical protein ETB97_010898 [Aspergillus burnettii]